MKKIINLLIIGCLSQSAFAQPITTQIKEFDTYIEKSRAAWQMPGMAVAVVKDGKVIFKKGFGVTQLGTKNMVNTQTIFGCGSTTKAMTAVCMALLVDEGKVSWDDAVVKHFPEFHLYDPAVTRELKIRDLFIHNSGVGNADFLWGVMDVSSDEILRKMQLVEPSYSLRSSFIYQNIFYLAAGKIIEKISGQKWEDFIQARIFQPLGMNRTFSTLKSIKDSNQSKPHYLVNGSIKVIESTSPDRVGPAGGVYSCIDDISKWVVCMLDSSKYEGGRLLKPTTWTELFKPQVIVPASQFYPTMKIIKPNWTTYGLGWFQHDYKGKKINYHTGSLAGEIAIHGQLPDAKLGIYVFGNYDHAELRHALVYKAFDLFALGGNRDWSAEFLTLYSGIKEKGEKEEKDFEAKRAANTNPSKPLVDYAGKYSDPLYGEVEVTLVGNKLFVNANNFLKATLSHWHYDTFRGEYEKDWYGKANATFTLNATGKIEKLNFEGMEFKKTN
jgi:CubicO group peptidase (beta-lactamase class C family)